MQCRTVRRSVIWIAASRLRSAAVGVNGMSDAVPTWLLWQSDEIIGRIVGHPSAPAL
jgi:hypothetical protein